jgi:hypothetical protein
MKIKIPSDLWKFRVRPGSARHRVTAIATGAGQDDGDQPVDNLMLDNGRFCVQLIVASRRRCLLRRRVPDR